MPSTAPAALQTRSVGWAASFGDRAFRYWSLAPLIIFLLVFSVYPMVQLALLSLSEVTYSRGTTQSRWVGLQHYLRLASDEAFLTALGNTLVFVVSTVVLELVLGLALALLAVKARRGTTLYRTVILLPLLVPPVAIGTAWRLMYNANFGLINMLALAWGLPTQMWLSDPAHAMKAVIAVDVWHWTAYVFLLLLAGLQTIPQELYEAGAIDGASGWRVLVHITLPLLRPTLLVALMFRTIHAFKAFDVIYLLTGGGPGLSTEVVNTYVQKVFMGQQQLGYGAALSMVSVVLVGIVALVYHRFLGVQKGAA